MTTTRGCLLRRRPRLPLHPGLLLTLLVLLTLGRAWADALTDRAVTLARQATGREALAVASELASDAYEGRRSGTPGGDAAADRILELMREAGLARVRKEAFSFPYFHTLEMELSSKAAGLSTDKTVPLTATLRTPPGEYLLVAAGQGSREELASAAEAAEAEPWVALVRGLNPIQRGTFLPFLHRVVWAEEAGASGVVFWDCPAWPGAWANRDRINVGYAPPEAPNTPPLERAPRIGALSIGTDVGQALTRALGLPDPLLFPEGSVGFRERVTVRMSVETVHESRTAVNVIGEVPGTARPERLVVVGAHYDHLGAGRFSPNGYRPTGTDVLFNGANDNASGTACLLAAARALAASQPDRTLWFVAFGAEEEGLLGAHALMDRYPSLPFAADAMVNMDMVGVGARSSPTARVLLRVEDMPEGESPLSDLVLQAAESLAQSGDLLLRNGAGGGIDEVVRHPFEGYSDHEVFGRAKVPATVLDTGSPWDPHYHSVSDEPGVLQEGVLEAAARVAAAAAYVAAGQAERPGARRAKGDLTNDGLVDVRDAVLALRMSAGQVAALLDDVAVADVAPERPDGSRGDGALTVLDALQLLRVSIGLARL